MERLPDLTGRTALVTGATSGVGQQTARSLARAGAHVVLVARDPDRGASERAAIVDAGGSAELLLADLSLQSEVRAAAEQFRARHDRLHILVNNAGAVFLSRELTAEGIERTWALNHLAYFLLTQLLHEPLAAGAPARVVSVSSDAHRGGRIHWDDPELRHGYSGWRAYGQSKLANVLFARELAHRLQGTGVTSNAVHPGFVASNFGRNNGLLGRVAMALASPFGRSPERGAETVLWLAAHPDAGSLSGQYLADLRVRKPSAEARSGAAAARLWSLTEQMCGLVAHPRPEGFLGSDSSA